MYPLNLYSLPAKSKEILKDTLTAVVSAQPPTKSVDKKTIKGYAAVAQHILSTSKDNALMSLFDVSDSEKTEISQWIEFALAHLKGKAFENSSITRLNEHLIDRSFVIGYHITLADIFICMYIHSYMEQLCKDQKKVASVVHLVRWFDLIQHTIPHAIDFHPMLDIKLDNPLLEKPVAVSATESQTTKKTDTFKESKKDGKQVNDASTSTKVKISDNQNVTKGKESAVKDADNEKGKDNKKKEDRKAVNEAKKLAKDVTGEEKSANNEIDPSRLDLRVGQIIACKQHEDADTLYVEQINVGEETPRTVVSGLVKHIPLAEMQNKWVVLLCNLKPANMRGVKSHAMVLATTAPDGKVELLEPPKGCRVGEKAYFETFEKGVPDGVLNPKKKTWENIQPNLQTNNELTAGFRHPVDGRFCKLVTINGVVKSTTVKGGSIK